MLPFFKNKLNLDNIYTHLCYTHTFHSLYSMHTHCVGIPCLIYKKRNPRVCFNTSSIQTAPITARCPQGTSHSAVTDAKLAGQGIHASVQRDVTQDMLSHKHSTSITYRALLHIYPFYFRTAMISIYMDFRYYSCK